nr:putative RNA-dependent RNA polymerase [Aplosporella javeedii partitivirus 1]
MVLNNVRNYLAEKYARLTNEWKLFQVHQASPPDVLQAHKDSDLDRIYRSLRYDFTHPEIEEQYKMQANHFETIFNEKSEQQKFPAEFYLPRDLSTLPTNRIPPSGISALPYAFKAGQIVSATPEVPESGFHVDPRITRIIKHFYPDFMYYVDKYVRPLGTTDATVKDFFKTQTPCAPIDPSRRDLIIDLIIKKLDITPYLPIHFVDSLYDGTPLHTGTGYHNRPSFSINAHAVFSHPPEYKERPTSKGYYYNAFLESARSLIHYIKSTGFPFPTPPKDLHESLRQFFLERPTTLYTRNHISERDGNLKQRPVYAVDDLFIRIESMLTFPAHVLARKITCAIMYGYETLRGANCELDRLAQAYSSFFTIDWSAFDQRLPRVITDLFFTHFLERIIVVNHAYQPTYEYPVYPDLTADKMFQRLQGLISFLHTWYNNMVFITADGFSYVRHFSGVPSGMLNTQYLDSFGNLFLIIDGLIEFGFSPSEIDSIILFVMGDDNSGFTHWPLLRLQIFITFFESYALERYGMVLSKTKSIITAIRGKIETLSYQCNYGQPLRPIGKLVAQLAYPERGPRPKYMSARAIGLAYAACGSNVRFHNLCRDIYYEFLDDAADPEDPLTFKLMQEHLPGFLRIDESVRQQINLTEFPSIFDVREQVSQWQGPLPFQPKWNLAHFINQPDVIPSSAITMQQYRTQNAIPHPEIPALWTQQT